MKPFFQLTLQDVQRLRRKPVVGHAIYSVMSTQFNQAKQHLKTLYTGEVEESFVSKIILLNELY